MKALITVLFATLMSVSAFAAKTIPSMKSEPKLALHQIADSIVLGHNQQKGITVRLVSQYLGEGTDLSPRKKLFITFFHSEEMYSTHTVFALEDAFVWTFKSASRVSAGVYEIAYIDTDLKERRMVIDTQQVFTDDRNLKPEDFDSVYFHSTITVK